MALARNPLIDALEVDLLTQGIDRMLVFLRIPMPEQVRLLADVVLRRFFFLRHVGVRLETRLSLRRWYDRVYADTMELEEIALRLAMEAA